ncbi:hypothetical protein DPEC_G00213340 [Dallia pectoralis]|uniref:Uncharacterized protein n=1 Tax=Dallia pectoralis TaxID=75939 RepID=A0ACC2G6Q2_DALPE|nr:hypothetical protein DPEC_G00213340 [Dallia pectoralis]
MVLAMQRLSSGLLLGFFRCVALLLLFDSETRDFYEMLGVSQSSTDKQVKKAFYKLAMTYHPDRNKSPTAENIYREMAEAYKVLSNPKTRRQYNQHLFKSFQTDRTSELEEDLPLDGSDQNLFHIQLEDLFQAMEEEPFLEDLGHSWNFQLGEEDEIDLDEGQGFLGGSFFHHHRDQFRQQEEDLGTSEDFAR